ncbi:MAG TPA: hypothetical protein PKJ95_08095 [Atribacterota bacterium]|nr:hypothetical protein [Atribacterota bacterium]
MDNYHKEVEKSKDSSKEGILLMIMAAFFFALMAFVIKLLDNIPLIFAAILEITFLGVIPDPMSIIGSIMIIISGILHFKCSKNTG